MRLGPHVVACLLALLCAVVLCEKAKRDRNDKPYVYTCYWGTWSVYRPGSGKFDIEHIDPFLCTHIIYTFAGLGSNGKIIPLDEYLDLKENWGIGNFQKFVNLRKKNPHLTLLLAIGGWNEGSEKYGQMARDPAKRKVFVSSVVEILKKHDFDGLDMDWEYPANRGGKPDDKENFATLMREMREEFDKHGFVLTAAVSAGKATIDTAYDVPKMSQALHYIHVMTYDFHGEWEKTTGHNAPLYARPEETGDLRQLNVNYSINYWIQLGAQPQQLVLGLGSYGRSFTLSDPQKNGLDVDAAGAGKGGPYTEEAGTLGYNEICEDIKKGGWTVVWNDWHQAPYAYKGNQWVGYDDEKSIGLKVDFLKEMKLAGAMVWSVDTDDYLGKCGRKYPLSNRVVEVLSGGQVVRPTLPPTTQPPPPPTDESGNTVTVPEPTTQESRPTTVDDTVLTCKEQGYFRHPTDCQKFYYCQSDGSGGYIVSRFECAAGTAYDEAGKTCTHRDQVKC